MNLKLYINTIASDTAITLQTFVSGPKYFTHAEIVYEVVAHFVHIHINRRFDAA